VVGKEQGVWEALKLAQAVVVATQGELPAAANQGEGGFAQLKNVLDPKGVFGALPEMMRWGAS
jgi:hypothetical protein